ncbi:MAG TPA: glycosyltransferase family 2 protein [Candidatus Nitrosopolaris sp.]|nr:glycosyltransferase family 2 protein [Candidatus Nitrosopolaris sp.]
MTAQLTNLSIQIINYNSKKYLESCLDSLSKDLETANFSYTISVLDNNSGEDLRDLQARHKSKQVKFYESDKNLGFAAGHNWLAGRQKSQSILMLNPDVEFIQPQTIMRLLHRLQAQNNSKVVGPRLINAEGIQQLWDHGEISGHKAYVADKVNRSVWRERDKPAKVAWVSGAVFLIERAIFDQLGGFDENFFMYGEEEELCYRLRKSGRDVIYDPTITALHHGGVATSKNDRYAYHKRSQAYFIQKHAAKRFSYPLWRNLDKKINNRGE